MSQRQPTLKIGSLIVAHDEIVKITTQSYGVSSEVERKNAVLQAIQLVDGTIVPLASGQKVKEVVELINLYEQ